MFGGRRLDVVVQEQLVAIGQLAIDVVLVGDLDATEETLVQLPALPWPSERIGLVAVLDVAQGPADCVGHITQFDLGGQQQLLGLSEFTGDAILLLLEQFHRHGTGVVRLDQLVTFTGEPLDPSLLPITFLSPITVLLGECLTDERLDLAVLVDGQGVLPVVLDNLLLDHVDQHHPLGAVRPLARPTEAVEVGVDDAVTVLAVHDPKARAALAAEDAALQVVPMDAVLLLRQRMGPQLPLHRLERLVRDQPLVRALVRDALICHPPGVVGVAQQFVEVAD